MENPSVIILGDCDLDWRYVQSRLWQYGFLASHVERENDIVQYLISNTAAGVILVSTQSAAYDPIVVVQHIRLLAADIPIILLAQDSSEKLAIRALKATVDDYFASPFQLDDVTDGILKTLRQAKPTPQSHKRSHIKSCQVLTKNTIIGESAMMQHVRQTAAKFAKTNSNVLITGETGTGKELIAQLIHNLSSRKDQPMVCVNCAAIPENLLESELFGHVKGAFTGAHGNRDGTLMHANKGTLFLDEIGEMSPMAQAKILRAIETKVIQRVGCMQPTAVDIRVIAATNQDLEQLVDDKQFRKDLFFRLNVARLHLPPLRERKEDIAPLSQHFINQYNQTFHRKVMKLNDELYQQLLQYEWAGNVRELKNVIEAAFINQPQQEIASTELPEVYRDLLYTHCDNKLSSDNDERDKLLVALFETNWNKSKAAKKLNWSRMTLYRKIEKYNLKEKKDGTADQNIVPV